MTAKGPTRFPRPVRQRLKRAPGACWALIRTEARRAYEVPYHDHDFAEIFWIGHGRCEHWINGRVEELRQGDLVVLGPRDAHTNRVHRDGEFTITNLALAAPVAEGLARRHPVPFAAWWPGQGRPHFRTRLTPDQLARADAAALRLARRGRARLPLELFLLELAVLLEDRAAETGGGGVPDWLAAALASMQSERALAGGVRELVRRAARSHAHVARACRACLGQTPTALVNRMRAEEAKLLLSMTARPVLEIGLELGFESESQFFKVFRQHAGTTPRRFRHGQWSAPGKGPLGSRA